MINTDASVERRRRHALLGSQYLSRGSIIGTKNAIRFVSLCILISLVSGEPECNICGNGYKVGNSDAVIQMDSQPAVSCGALDDAGLAGRISEAACAMFPSVIFNFCECRSDSSVPETDPPVDPPTDSPVDPPTDPPVDPPTDAPVDPPTDPPVDPPTETPVSLPTNPPVSPPTDAPADPPTGAPVSLPTNPPVSPATDPPTDAPVSRPTDAPVEPPVVPDTESPVSLPQTPEPIQQATPEPSRKETPEPSRQATAKPTQQATPPATPTVTPQPGSEPSPLPTSSASSLPTMPATTTTDPATQWPSQFPSTIGTTMPSTGTPTGTGSLVPSIFGTPTGTGSLVPSIISPSEAPSTTPSAKITAAPTLSQSPSLYPTPTPTGIEPTSSPFPTIATDSPSSSSGAPSLAMQNFLVEVVMYMKGIPDILDSGSEITFQTETARHIRSDFLNDLADLTVGTNIRSQDMLRPSSTGSRRLQATSVTVTVTTLKIVFDTAVAYRSPIENLDVAALIGAAFDSPEDLAAYISRLQSVGGDPFTSITSISIEINGVPQKVQQEQTEPPKNVQQLAVDGGVGLPVIIGACVGGVALVAIVLFAILRKQKHQPCDDNVTFASSKKDLGNEHVNTNIVVEPQDDISTLGDPMPGVLMLQQDDISTLGEPITDSALDRDETVSGSIISGDYEYHKNYANQGHLKSQDSLLQSLPSANGHADDGLSVEESLGLDEERFQVTAPAGKLGMVIDTPGGGSPVVHAIKGTSSLANTGIQVGDRLVAIDGIDTTCFTAMQVSKLISQKANNPSRVLEFVRARRGGIPQ